MKNNCTLLILVMLFIPLFLPAQFYADGADPARARWRRIQAGTYQIIYPQEIDSLARRYAWLFERATPHVMAPLETSAPRIPVVLHPYTMNSNGMVVWAPKRMELYTSAPASQYAQKWENQLVLHETRHVAQMSKMSRHVFRVAEFFVGQQSQGIAVGGYVPKWILEGDAVLSETEHSFSGRGREAAFLMPYKAYLLDSISFGCDTWRFGSYKYAIPNHYHLGYYLLSAVRYHTCASTLSCVFDLITRRPYIPFISQSAYHQYTGYTYLQSWGIATQIYTQEWRRLLVQSGPQTPYQTLTNQRATVSPRNKQKRPVEDYANYQSIVARSKDSVFALYYNLNRPPSLLQIDANGKEKHLRYTGTVNSDLTQGGGRLYWAELVPGPRWEQEAFSVIRSYDPRTQKFASLTTKSRYLNPSVSPSGTQIAVTEAAISGLSSLCLLSADDGTVRASIPAPDGGHLQSTAWASDSLLYAAVVTDSGLGIYALHVASKTWNNTVPPQYRSISRLHYANGWLYFSSDVNGTDNIFALNPHVTSPQLFALTNAKYGAFSPWLLHDTLYYAHYTHAGLRPVMTPLSSLPPKNASFGTPYEPPVAAELSRQVGFSLDTVAIPQQPQYVSKPYHKGLNLFRFHSWIPVYYNVDNISALSLDKWYDAVSLGAVLFSQNTLSTAITQLGYAYRNGYHAGHLKFTWQGWYPVIELAADINDRKAGQYKVEKTEDNKNQSTYTVLDHPSFRASANIYIPFNLRSRGWVRGLIPRIHFSFRNDQFFSPEKEVFQNYMALQAGIQYYQYRSMALRNIYPRWGVGTSIQTASAPWNNHVFGSELYAMVYGYLPGLFVNQGLKLKAAWQRQWIEGRLYYLSNLAALPRGYSNLPSQKYMGFSADYAIPVWLGDIHLGGLAYFKRLQIIPFFDWAKNMNHQGTQYLYSLGTDLLLDMHVLRIGAPISAGIRTLFKGDGKAVVEALFSIKVR